MNRIHKSIWNERTGTFVAVSENARSRGKKSSETNSGGMNTALKALCASLLLAYGPMALALPLGGQVSAGSAAISTGPGRMTVTQSTQNAAINWQSFNIGSKESVNFVQPSSSSVTLNRVLGNDPSSILGSLTANGRVFLINPNGVLFGKGSQVNVGGLVASTLNLSDADFMAGRYRFSGKGGSIDNQGSINANGGYVALLGGKVSNEGVITAQLGTVALAGGNAVTLDVAGDGLLSIAVNQGAVNAEVANGGLIRADGGTVLMTTRAADALLNDVVNNGGIIEARTIDAHGGQISLLGSSDSGTVNVSGTLDASAPNGGNGGKIETSASHVKIANDAKITTLSFNGLTGSWLIDPNDFTVASTGGDITGTALTTALGSGSVTIQATSTTASCTGVSCTSTGTSGNGDIYVNDNVSWSANTTLTLNAYRNIYIDKSVTSSGASGKLSLLYGQGAANGVIGGTTSTYSINAPVSLAAGSNFSTQLGSAGTVVNYTVITTLGAAGSTTRTDLQGMSGNTAGNYALGANIDASSTSIWNGNAGFSPVGGGGFQFTGNFEGLGHTISSLTINRSGTNNVGLFGYGNTSGVIRDIGLVGGSFTGGQSLGPLVGYLNNGVIVNSFATGSVSGSGYVGGLVGNMLGGSISNSFATGSVTATGNAAGGLVGIMYKAATAPSVNDSYATGAVTAPTGAGALVGSNSNGIVSNSFYETGINGSMTGISGFPDAAGKVYGMSSASMQNQANFTTATSANGSVNPGWDFTNASWGFGNVASGTSNANSNLPVLCTFGGCLISVYVDPVSGSSVYGSTPVFNYNLVNASGAAYTLTNASVTGTATYAGNPSLPTAASNTGSYTVTYSSGLSLSGANAGSYALKAYQPASTNWTVTPKTVTLSATKTYDGTTGLTGAVTVGTGISGQSLTYTGATSNDANVATAGKYINSITLANGTGGIASNYQLPTLNATNAPVTINPATVTLSASKIYDGTTSLTGNVTVGTGISGQSLTYTGATSNDANVATANKYISSITLANGTVGVASNYQLPTLNAATAPVTINPASLTVTASDYTKTYDGNAYSGGNGVTYSGLAKGDTAASILSGTPTYGGTSQNAVNTGTYTIAPSGLTTTSSNYSLSYANGSLTVTQAPLNATVSKTYDGTSTFTTGLTFTGMVNGDAMPTVTSGSVAVSSRNVGTYTSLTSNNLILSNGNYTITGGTAAVSIIQLSSVDWVGGATGSWSSASSWAPSSNHSATGAIPDGKNVANVNIPAGATVTFDSNVAATTLSSLNAGKATSASGSLTLSGGSLTLTGSTALSIFAMTGGTWSQIASTLPAFSVTSFNYSGGSFVRALGGDGSANSPYQLTDIYGVQGMGGNSSGHYVLANDIDASGTSNWNSGAGFNPIVFAGRFDGQNHIISNLLINRPSANNVGLFGYTGSGSTISNVGLVGGSVSGGSYVGGLAGKNSGTISNSYATGSVSGGGYVGGLAGNNYGSISNSYATGNVSVSGSNNNFGGLAGQNHGTISNSYATGNITGNSGVGGLAGNNSGSISNSYAIGKVTGSGINVGGLVGYFYSGTISNSFWDTATSGHNSSEGGRGMTTAQMQTQANFTSATSANGNANPNWDFTNTWVMYDGHTYPLLRSFMTPLTVTAGSFSKTNDGNAYSGGNGVTYSVTPNSNLLGTVSYGGTSQGAVIAGSYTIVPSGLYSNQQGYAINFVNGTLTVNPSPLSVTSTSSTLFANAWVVGGEALQTTYTLSNGDHVYQNTWVSLGADGNPVVNTVTYGNTATGLTIFSSNTSTMSTLANAEVAKSEAEDPEGGGIDNAFLPAYLASVVANKGGSAGASGESLALSGLAGLANGPASVPPAVQGALTLVDQ